MLVGVETDSGALLYCRVQQCSGVLRAVAHGFNRAAQP